jgi:OOP family OmpA-OmpF porin
MTSSQPVRKAVQPVPYAEPATTEKAAAAQSQTLMSNPAKLPVKQNVVSKLVIEFTFDKFTISPDYLKKLQEFAGLMQSNPDMVATIEGHTDSLGSESYNLKLSRQRAESVKNSLLGFGAAADRVTTVGYGFSKPVASNATSNGRQRNRRAVTIVTFTRN